MSRHNEPELAVERWTYIGRRLSGEKLVYGWLDQSGMALYFAKGKGHAIGATYDVTVDRSDGGVTRHGSPAFGESAGRDDDRVPVWQAEDANAYAADQRRKREQKARRDGRFGEVTLDELAGLYRKVPDQTALLAQVMAYIARGPR